MSGLNALPPVDAVLVSSTINDVSVPPDEVASVAKSLWASIRKTRPATPLIVTGTQGRLVYSGGFDVLNRNLKDAAQADADVVDAFVDLRDPMIITGNGHEAAPAFDGNADLFVAPDGTHMTHAGIRHYAEHLAHRLGPVMLLAARG